MFHCLHLLSDKGEDEVNGIISTSYCILVWTYHHGVFAQSEGSMQEAEETAEIIGKMEDYSSQSH